MKGKILLIKLQCSKVCNRHTPLIDGILRWGSVGVDGSISVGRYWRKLHKTKKMCNNIEKKNASPENASAITVHLNI